MQENSARKVALVTGGSRGLGATIAAALAADDVDVAISYVSSADKAEAVVQKLEAQGVRALAVRSDAADPAAAAALVDEVVAHFGRLDIVVNCAGGGRYGAVEELSEEGARRTFDVNFFGSLWVTQAALPILREQGSGHILMVSSIGGMVSSSSLGLYHATKWALEALSEALSLEVDQFGIKVTILEPTGYRTAAHEHSGDSAPHSAYEREPGMARLSAPTTVLVTGDRSPAVRRSVAYTDKSSAKSAFRPTCVLLVPLQRTVSLADRYNVSASS